MTEPTQHDKSDKKDRTIACIFVGMAGSGKTTLMRCLNLYFERNKISQYKVNLDPACKHCYFNPKVDIRDSVKYHDVMKLYSLGPNGAIMTSLNLFATKFDQVLSLVEKAHPKYALFDTPGQIEVFTWSASGALITEMLGVSFPTVIVYVVDIPRSKENPSTFMANMLYAISILYKTKLPIVLALTKNDVFNEEMILEWMRDPIKFEAAAESEQTYAGDLLSSMALTLEEFYETLKTVGVSAKTGEGIPQLLKAIEEAADLYETTYKVDLENRKKDKEAKRQEEELEKIAELKLDDVAPIGRDASQTSQEPFVRGERVDLGGEDGEQENDDGIDSDSIDEADY